MKYSIRKSTRARTINYTKSLLDHNRGREGGLEQANCLFSYAAVCCLSCQRSLMCDRNVTRNLFHTLYVVNSPNNC